MERKAVVFTHIYMRDVQRFREAERDGTLSKLVLNEWGEMLKAYADCKEVNMIFLFLSDAYIAYIRNLPEFTELKRLEIAIEGELLEAIRIQSGQNFVNKFRVVGVSNLQALLATFRELCLGINAKRLNDLLLGAGSQLFYDSPKVVEAIIRLARRHNNEPVLRFDEDVIINGESVKTLIEVYDNMVANGEQYFFFSGSYRTNDRERESEMFWLNDFAVRTHFLSIPDNGDYKLDVKLAEKFIQQISTIGADVYNQPVSGAGLCISPMAIMQLPPFANVGRNIIWIDDAIKRALHVGIGDIAPSAVREVQRARFNQDRYGGTVIRQKDMDWGIQNYVPRLVHGCLMHSTMVDLGGITSEGPFAAYLINYMRTKKKPTAADREKWRNTIIERLAAIRAAWNENTYLNNPAGEKLADWASNALDINKPQAKKFVNEVMVDLEKYIDLMDIWPYIIRTIDFEVRRDTQKLSWLVS